MCWFLPHINMNTRYTCVPSLLNPSPTSLPLPPSASRVLQSIDLRFPVPCIELPLATYLTYGKVYISMLFSQVSPPSPSPTVHKSLLSVSVSPLLPCMQGRLYCLCRYACVLRHVSCVRLFATPRTVAWQASLSVGFSRQEYWSGLSCRPPRHLPDPGIEPASPSLQVDSLLLSHWGRMIPCVCIVLVIEGFSSQVWAHPLWFLTVTLSLQLC